ncbi:MAG: hypothetical protein MHM6MM_000527 [Cercozoa sp. M6MM]
MSKADVAAVQQQLMQLQQQSYLTQTMIKITSACWDKCVDASSSSSSLSSSEEACLSKCAANYIKAATYLAERSSDH